MGVIVVTDDDDNAVEPSFDSDPPAPPAPPVAPPTPPAASTREQELEATVAKLSGAVARNNRENAKHRSVAKLMQQLGITDLPAWLAERNIDPATGQPMAPAVTEPDPEPEFEEPGGEFDEGTEDEPEPDQEGEEQSEAEEDSEELVHYRGRTATLAQALKRTAVAGELKALGFSGTLEKAIRVLEADGTLEGIEIDEEGNVVGAAEAAQELRKELPEWFARRQAPPPPPGRQPAPGVDAGDRRGAPPRKLSWDQQIDRKLRGR